MPKKILFSFLIPIFFFTLALADDFEATISQHYIELLDFYNSGELDQALDKIEQFRKNAQMNYKDVREIQKKAKTGLLLYKAKQLPESEVITKLSLYRQLSDLNPENKAIKARLEYYHKEYVKLPAEEKPLAGWGNTNTHKTYSNQRSETDVKSIISRLPSHVTQTIYEKCKGDWPNDFRMQRWCIKKQAEAWLEIN